MCDGDGTAFHVGLERGSTRAVRHKIVGCYQWWELKRRFWERIVAVRFQGSSMCQCRGCAMLPTWIRGRGAVRNARIQEG